MANASSWAEKAAHADLRKRVSRHTILSPETKIKVEGLSKFFAFIHDSWDGKEFYGDYAAKAFHLLMSNPDLISKYGQLLKDRS